MRIGLGFLIGRDELVNFLFDPSKSYAGCRICGDIYQGPHEEDWKQIHNRKHSDREHIQLARSGRRFTPEAAQRLAPFGVIDFGGLLTDSELRHAYATADRAPANDVETSLGRRR